MKRLFTLIAFIFYVTSAAFAQDYLSFSKVIEAPGISKDDLFTRSEIWMAEMLIDWLDTSKLILDREGGVCIAKTSRRYSVKENHSMDNRALGFLNSIVKIEVKENKARITLYRWSHEGLNQSFQSLGILDNGDWTKDDKSWKKEAWDDAKKKSKIISELNFISYENAILATDDQW